MLAVLILGLLFVLQLPSVQTGLAKYAVSKLEGSIDGRLEIGSIQIQPFSAVTVRDVVLIDNNPTQDSLGRGLHSLDTLAAVGRMSVTINPVSFLRHGRIEPRWRPTGCCSSSA